MADGMIRVPVTEQDAQLRAKNFDEVCLGYTEDEAVDEANDMLLCEYGPTAKLYDKPIVSSPICRSGWDHKSAALIRLDALYEYAAKTGNMSEVQRIGEEIAQLVDQL